MTIVDEAKRVLAQLVPQLQDEGYTVFVEPSRQLLPSFLEGYTPDAIAIRDDKNLAIEVRVEGPLSKSTEVQLEQRFKNRKDWDLRVYYARPAGTGESLPAMTIEAIDSSIASVENLISKGDFSAANLIGWATFEALAR